MRLNKASALAVLAIIVLTFTSCIVANDGGEGKADKNYINVSIQKGDGYTVTQGVQSVLSGSDVKFTVIPKQGYSILDFSYSDYQYLGDNVYLFKNMRYPTVIEVYCAINNVTDPPTQVPTPSADQTPESTPTVEVTVTPAPTPTKPNGTVRPSEIPTKLPELNLDIDAAIKDEGLVNSIIYCFNGGEYVNSQGVTMMQTWANTSHHQRINTYNVEANLKKDGHTLIGWNTKPDGSGVHVSLGSRCTLNTQGATVLYASWVKWSNASDFTYTASGGNAYITGYSGSDAVLSIPAELDGYKVTRIKSGAVTGAKCQKVVFPSSIKTVDSKAFKDCSITTLHFFDTVKSMEDDSFYDCPDFSTLYINQLKPPVYITGNGKVEAYDSLILSKKKSVVFFAGSSVLYGIDAYRAAEQFKDTEYDVINLGWTAPRNALFQVLIITELLNEGDVFLHAPEYISSCHFMRSIGMGGSAWQILDCNLDLFSYVDIRKLPKAISSFCTFTNTKDNAKKTYTYDHYCSSMDYLGYKCSDRPVIRKESWAPDGECKISASIITDVSLERLGELYSNIEKRGATVYLSYPPINQNYIHKDYLTPQSRQGFVDRFEMLGRPILGSPEDFFYNGSYFHDTEYHLVTKGAQEHTDKITAMLKARMQTDGLI
ncbi:MAG: leucine-rich repeat protein [Clostridia bacterium]|nr:leucine-rich repeat protein [Clostridia bacterium]